MVELGLSINKVENDEKLMPPGHGTLLNTSQIHMAYIYIEEFNSILI